MAASLVTHVAKGHQTSNHIDFPIAFEQFHDLPETNQRLLGEHHPSGTVTPLALRPSSQLEDIQLHVVVHTLESLQRQDLPIHGAEDFGKFAHAFGYKLHEIIGIVVDRPLLAPKVAPANESPKEVLIYNHNESPQVPHAPEYVFFYNHKALSKGGESPISSSLELFHRAKNEIPESIQELTGEGILSRVTYKFDKQYTGGSTLQQACGKDFLEGDSVATKRTKIEAQIARYGRGKHTTWEWIDDGVVLTHRLPAIRGQPGTGLPTLFTGLAAYWKNSQGGNGARKEVTKQLYGDGTPIPDKYLEHLAKITDEIRVLHNWQQGDVLVFDNVIAQHGRQPWEGEQSDRVVLARIPTLFDGDSVPGAYGDGDWVQVVQALDG
ncbi:hypothetical protein BDP81DRAFT_480761 [Colletotrichum phormii]|uniref:TauD/TfdA-like domain-containing protein n=1 Tax=Colletotrichum phormii TaxID=359342 RepID=A0AAI9ZWL0_9PEZI|nr:uncharacterized protein BDP81DRAFT_480761 [Colletotrichum phormii]KAK1637922.1 hypothetical protein BDP81DRAFT_480761 [Colletotrichum phormii]